MSGPGWYSFGRATHGELGRPSHTGPEGVENADVRPIKVEGVEIETIACGHFHNIALSTEHQVFAWGANGHGQLGTEHDGKTPAAAQQLQALLGDEQISHFCAGRNHSVFLSSTGRPFISGGLPAAEPGVSKVTSTQAVREIHVTDGSEEPEGRLVAVAVGESQTFFLSSEGELWSWLGEEDRQERRRILGHFQRPTARAVLGLPRVAEVTCGLHHTLILTEERKIFSFGAGSLGQLGLGPCRRCPTPSQVMFPPQCDGCLCGIAAGFASSFAVTEQGWVYSWGCNEKCELGLGTSLRGAARPKPIDALYQVKVTQVAAGFAHTACVTDSGLLYLWGYGAYGQLGFGFDDLRSSMRLGNGWSAKGSPGVQADDAGFTSTGQSQPWQQVWPRRCRRGPFRTRRCVRVECGAYHTIAQASKFLLGDDARNESEVLCPLPLEVSDLPAGTMALMEADQQWPQGAGLAECPRPVLRQKATRTVEIFRSLADLFWETKPCRTPLPETPRDVLPPQRHPVEGPRWRRALKPPVRSGSVVVLHPLQNVSSHHTSPRSPEKLVGLPLPGTSRVTMTTWTEVDEAVHKAFHRGDVSAPLPELLAELVEVAGPGVAGPPGLPSSPSQGLARLECLTPRPFYLPEQEPDLTNISGAPVPIDAEDALNKPVIQGILPEVVGEIDQARPGEEEVAEKSPDDSAGAEDADDAEELAEKNRLEDFAARVDEDEEAAEVVEKDPPAAENAAAAADAEVAEKTPDESAAEDVLDVVPPNGTAEDIEDSEAKNSAAAAEAEEAKAVDESVEEEEEKGAQEVAKEAGSSQAPLPVAEAAATTEEADDGTKSRRNRRRRRR